MDSQPDLRRNAFILLGGLLAIILISWLWRFYHTGTIVITTQDRYSTISISEIGATGQNIGKNYKAHSKLSVTVHTGKYMVSVTGNSVATVQTVTLKPRQTLSYAINPLNTTGVEPVAYENAQDIAVSGDKLIYLDGSSNTLSTIDKQNRLTENNNEDDDVQQFQTVKWASPSFGIGQDDKGRLYTIAGTSVSPLKVPFLYGGGAVNFDVAANKKIYVSYGKDVYAGGGDGGFKKIYTASSSKPALAASSDQVAVSDSKYGANTSNISEPLLATINASGKTSKKNVESERLAWSPDGQHLATVNDTNPTIYDATLHMVTVIPAGSTVGQFTWLNDNTLLYTANDQLWTYNLLLQKAQLLANMPLADSITGLYTSSDKSYIYVTTVNAASSTYAIKRIGLKGQKIPDYIYNLQDVLPLNSGPYILSLVNFSGSPTIVVSVYPGTASTAGAQQSAMQRLQSLGFDTSKLRFEVVQLET